MGNLVGAGNDLIDFIGSALMSLVNVLKCNKIYRAVKVIPFLATD